MYTMTGHITNTAPIEQVIDAQLAAQNNQEQP